MRKTTYLLTGLILIQLLCVSLSAQTTQFTYQGSLKDGANAASGNYDFEFVLFDALSGGTQVGSTLTKSSVAVANGIFSVSLDFGPSYPGAARFLEIHVRPAGVGLFTTLAPRQPVNSSPYSVKTLNADTAANATNATNATNAINANNATTAATATNATQLGGVAANQYVLTGDVRLSDARPPTAGSSNYIQNGNAQQPTSNFNVSGNGTTGGTLSGNVVNAATQFNLGGNRILSNAGTQNLFAGNNSGAANTTGISNAFFGYAAGSLNTTGFFNAFFGDEAAVSNTTGFNNSFFGFQAGYGNTTGGNNTFIGNLAGLSNQTGNSNTIVGYLSTFGTGNLSNSTAIGANSRVDSSNSLVLGSINGINGATADTNVGIGTTAPTTRLHVVGNGLITGNLTVNGTLNLPSFAGQFIQNTTSQQANSNFSVSGNGFVNGSGGVGTTSDTFLGSPARFTVVQQQPGQWASHIGTNNFAAGNSFGLLIDAGTNSSDDAVRVRDQSGTNQVFSVKGNGFVGIGTANPTTNLHLLANAPQGFAIQLENTSTAKKLFIGNYGAVGAGNHWPGLDSANTSFLYAENSLVFTTPGGIMFSGSTTAEHMRIATNGNIGIGTTSPSSKFTLNSTTPNAFAATLQTSGVATGSSYGVVINAGTDVTDSALQVNSQSGTPYMRVRGNGYVGIGTTNPQTRFQVAEPLGGAVAASFSGDWGVTILGTHSALSASAAGHTFQVTATGASVSGGLTTDTFVSGNSTFNGSVTLTNLGSGGFPQVCFDNNTHSLLICGSSRRFKTNIQNLDRGMDLIRHLRPVTFNWKRDGRNDVGLIAEEVEAVDPRLVTYRQDGQIQGVRYDLMGVVLINAVKEQQRIIESQQQQNDELRKELGELKAVVCSIKTDAEICRK